MARANKRKAIERLQNALNEIPALEKLQPGSCAFEKWSRRTRLAISHTFEGDSKHITEFDNIRYQRIVVAAWGVTSDHERHTTYVGGLKKARSLLESMAEEIEEYWKEDELIPTPSDAAAGIAQTMNSVFVIHGHDEFAREAVARFLEKLELEPVILFERPNQGHTIIEKIEHNADVGFAVGLLTPDDLGTHRNDRDKLVPRARQNVIFELGYFAGKLGRKRVCALVKEDVETPSDYDGVVYIDFDKAGAWKMKLVQELKSAGFNVDANRALQQ